MLKIGEVAKKTGISIRSLRHYDEIGLLKPSSHSEAGYRLYIKSDILRLQQIVSLQQMKFPLKRIQSILMGQDSMSLQQTLQLQQQFLEQQLTQQQTLSRRINQLLSRLSACHDISLELIYQTMESIKMLEKYYTPTQIETLQNRSFHVVDTERQEWSQAWDEIFSGLERLQSNGVPATDIKTKPIALKARALVSQFTGGDKGIEQSLENMYQQEGGGQMLRNHGLDVSDEQYAYYEAALHAHAKST